MSSTYIANPGNVTPSAVYSCTIPSDGDPATAASVNSPGPFESDADMLEWLSQTVAINAACNIKTAGPLTVAPIRHGSVFPTGYHGIGTSNQWVSLGTSGALYTADGNLGSAWTSRTSNAGTAALQAGASNGTMLVVVGAPTGGHPAITTSTDGGVWTLQTNPGVAQTLASVAWSPTLSLWCAVGSSGLVLTSPDGITWTSRSAGANSFGRVLWAPGPALFIAITTTTYYTSPDGITWTLRTTPASGNLLSIAASPSIIVMSDSSVSGPLYSSTDGINWTTHAAVLDASITDVIWTGKIFIAGYSQSYFATSPDGLTWTKRQPVLPDSATRITVLSMAAHPLNGAVLFYESGSTSAIFISAPWVGANI